MADNSPEATAEDVARRRVAAIGKYKAAFDGFDLSLEALKAYKAENYDPVERLRRISASDF